MPRRRREAPVPNRRNLRRRGAAQPEGQPPARRQRVVNDVQPQPQPAENPPVVLPAQIQNVQHEQIIQQPQLLNVPQAQPLGEVNVNFDEPMLIPNVNETNVFISQGIKEKIWLFQYIDLAIMHKSNLNIQFEQQNIISINEQGRLVAQTKLARSKAISNIEAWTDAFISYSQVLIERHAQKASELFSYMAIIRSAASQCSIEKWYTYDQQFRLRVARDHTRNWGIIDSQLWLQFIALGIQKPQPSNSKCFDFNFKGQCQKDNCTYRHICIKCFMNHPFITCRRYTGSNLGQGNPRFPVNKPVRPLLPQQNYTAHTFAKRFR